MFAVDYYLFKIISVYNIIHRIMKTLPLLFLDFPGLIFKNSMNASYVWVIVNFFMVRKHFNFMLGFHAVVKTTKLPKMNVENTLSFVV